MCAAEGGAVAAVGVSAGLGVAPAEVTAAGADVGLGTGADVEAVEMAGVDAVATAGGEGAGGAGADLGAAGGSEDVADSAVGSVVGGGPAVAGSAASVADFGPRFPAGRRTPR